MARPMSEQYNALRAFVAADASAMRAAILSSHLSFVLNGRSAPIDLSSPHTTLLDYLRGNGLTGAKEGCAEGECGACAVAVATSEGEASCYRTVNSCLIPLPCVTGHEILTVEGLGQGGSLADAQAAMAASGGSQCGYCTPGFVMSLFAEQYRPGRIGPCDPLAMAGNLCRCTGYRPIRDAALSLGAAAPGWLARSSRLGRRRRSERSTIEGFSRPLSVDDMPRDTGSKSRTPRWLPAAPTSASSRTCTGRRWPIWSSVEAIDELRAVRRNRQTRAHRRRRCRSATSAGAGRRAPAVVHEWLELFASPLDPQPRHARRQSGHRLADWRRGAAPPGPGRVRRDRGQERTPDAFPLASISSPATGGRRCAPGETAHGDRDSEAAAASVRFYKVAKRRLDDISTVAAAMALDRDGAGRVGRARFAFGGVAATPVRASRSRGGRRRHGMEEIGGRAGAARARSRRSRRSATIGARQPYRSRCQRAWSRSSGGSAGHDQRRPARFRTRARAGTSPAKRSTPTIYWTLSAPAARVAGHVAARARARDSSRCDAGARRSPESSRC